MAARAEALGDRDESAPPRWEPPLGTAAVHVILTALAPTREQLERALISARRAYASEPGIRVLWRQD